MQLFMDILKNFLIPLISEKFPQGHRLMQEMMLNIQVACTGLIKRAWVELKRYSKMKPMNKSDLVGGIVQFWSWQLTQEKCIKHIEHMHTPTKGCGITGQVCR